MKKNVIDINCDMGEGVGNDALLMPYIHSCSIACGYHAGSDSTMKETIALAKQMQVNIGAHPSFPDRASFGRTDMTLPYHELVKIIVQQIRILGSYCKEAKARLVHVKPHGALYNMAVYDENVASAIVAAIRSYDASLTLFAPSISLVSRLARESNLPVVYEAFADRLYEEDLTLVSRQQKDAVLQDPEAVWAQVKDIVEKGSVRAASGKIVPIVAETVCIHGDNLKAVEIVRFLFNKMA